MCFGTYFCIFEKLFKTSILAQLNFELTAQKATHLSPHFKNAYSGVWRPLHEFGEAVADSPALGSRSNKSHVPLKGLYHTLFRL